jgi:hypothetical protein
MNNKNIIPKREEKEKKAVDISKTAEGISEVTDLKSEKGKILEKTAKEYFDSAKEEFNKARYNSSVVLYFKSLIALVDLFILQETGNTPSSHNERFRITQEKFPEVYELLDKDFPFYQNSYFQIMSKELAEVIKNDAEIMAGKTKIKL